MISFTCALIVATLAQTAPASPEAELNLALGVAGLSSQTARFDPGMRNLFGQGGFTTPIYSALDANPWRAPFIMSVKRDELAGYVGRPSESLMSGGLWTGWGTRRTLVGDPIASEVEAAKKPGALASVLARMKREGLLTGRVPVLMSVPAPVQQATALILETAMKSRALRKVAVAGIGNGSVLFKQLNEVTPDEDPAAFAKLLAAYGGFRPTYMAAAAHDLTLAVQTATPLLSTVAPTTNYSVQIPTAWGSIRLSGGGPTTHANEPNLLTIDTGGSDTYINGATTLSVNNWLSIVLDSDGNDKYVSALPLQTVPIAQYAPRKTGNTPGPGGAVLGVSILFDLNGNDLYRSHRPGLGSGRLGVGVVFDAGGDDVYDGYADSIGFGQFGAGILEDNGTGNDVYQGFNQVQGCGLTRGFGYLVDRGGNDQYLANDETIDFASPQSDKHNVSMAQGAGNGRRADYLDGQSLAGGVGILFDMAGDDRYRSGVFGQGVGYWMGVGALWDRAGVDRYEGQWYVQGACAHFAIGYLEDEAGNDNYNAPMNMAQGAGHDFSVGILLDRAGDDSYAAPNLSLGAGNANGIGWFADLQGNDRYQSSGVTLGRAAEAPVGSLRARALTLGVFMDLSGNDTFSAATPWAVPGARTAQWTQRLLNPAESQVGVFWDPILNPNNFQPGEG